MGHHLDRLTDLIVTTKNVTNIMKRAPPLEETVRNIEKMVEDIHNRVDKLGRRFMGIENIMKNIAKQSCSILKVTIENIKILLVE